ncbi:MAG: DUF1800 domain-containing protein [Vicinamibacterales bacterium]
MSDRRMTFISAEAGRASFGRQALLALLAAVLLIAGPDLLAQKKAAAVPASPDDRTIVHVLNRIGFGPTAGEIARVRSVGLAQYIDRQLHPERIPDEEIAARLAPFQTLQKSTRELAEEYYIPALTLRRREQQRQARAGGATPPDPEMTRRELRSPDQMDAMRAERSVLAELSQQRLIRAVHSDRQLEEVLVDFWFNHFNVFAGKGATRLYLTEYERDVIRPHVLGRFRDLLGATAHSPAMLFYLDNWQSAAPNQDRVARRAQLLRRRGVPQVANQPNRPPLGLNENYARELMELHTLGVDGGYTQKDVQEVARAFTGWTIEMPRQGGSFRFEPRIHDDGEKVVLGHRIKAGGGKKDGEQVLDILAAHPSTARFVATKLARKFVADVPPPSLVDRAAARFRETGGDIREVVRTIVTSPEFFAPAAYRAKVKSPYEFVVSATRAAEVDVAGALPMVQALRELGMPLYFCQPPTGYADRADAWVNTGALLNRMNFAVSLTQGKLRGLKRGGPIDASAAPDREALFQTALAGDVSASTRATVAKATTTAQSIALILGSPEFQKR